ncbi:MAG: START-like domain-containing protein [Bacteroidia bacterium]
MAAKAKPASKQTDLKTAKKPDVTSKKPEVKAKPVAEKSSKPEKKSGFTAPVTQAPKKGKDVKTVAPKPEKPGKPSKSKKKEDEEDGEEGPDPLHLKADKVIKELEEIMDLTKMRPRIQAGTSPKQTIVKPAHPPLKLIEPSNTLKEKFQLEFEFRSSPKILFTSLSDSSGLAGWFADEVKTKDDLYTFIWEGGESYARLVAIRELQLVRFQWLDDTDGTYFQFEIKEDDITSDIALVITDFANPGEKDSSIKLWESQVQNLRMLLGSL